MTLQLVVADIIQQTADIKSFILKAKDAGALPAFEAGAHLNVGVTLADGSRATRSYSIANAQSERDHYELGVLRQSDGSRYMHEQLSIGMDVEISLPVNNFRLVNQPDAEHVLIAGGIGITPMLSMARTLAQQARRFELHYFGRSADSLAFRDAVKALQTEAKVSEYIGKDREQVILLLKVILKQPGPQRHVYICGPGGMIQTLIELAQEAGWPSNHVHYEQFSAAVIGLNNAAFTVELALSNRQIEVAADQTLLDALLEAGVEAFYDCRSGICGSCLVPVTSGEIDHRDSVLSDEDKSENSLICTCVSRARGAKLVLDI